MSLSQPSGKNQPNAESQRDEKLPIPANNGTSITKNGMDEDVYVETRCGFGPCYPLFLQPFARVGCFTFFYSLSNLITSTLSVYVNSQMTTLERQFGFSSSQTGLILAANDLGYLLIVLFASYTAAYMHVPRSLGISTSFFAVSGIMCSLPFFIFRNEIGDFVATFANIKRGNSATPRRGAGAIGDLCTLNSTLDATCDSAKGTNSEAVAALPAGIVSASLVIIVVGMALQGCAKSPRNSFTVTYIDNNAKKTSTGLYIGIISAMGVLGPVLAFVLGGFCSKMFVTLGETNLNPRHPKWIGAWWLGYLLCGGIAFVIAIPLMFFPRRLPRRDHNSTPDNESAVRGKDGQPLMPKIQPEAENDEEQNDKWKIVYILHHVRSFFSAVVRLLKNWVFVCLVIASCSELLGFVGTNAFVPKYVEQVFDMPPFEANYTMAGRALFGGVIGMFVGGYLTKRFKMTTTQLLMFAIGCAIISVTCELLGLVFYCEQPTVHNWPGTEESCSGSCGCEENSFFAICGSDDKTYYSPCTAGCLDAAKGAYNNCTCIPGDGMAKGGICPYRCNYLYFYLIASTTRILIVSISVVPKMLILIRCVMPKDKGLAIGLATFCQSLFGWMGGPVIFGYVVDGICSVWDVNNCDGTTGRCLFYDNNIFRIKIHTFSSCFSGVHATFLVIALIYSRRTGFLQLMHESHMGGPGNGGGEGYQFVNQGKEENEGVVPIKRESNSTTVI